MQTYAQTMEDLDQWVHEHGKRSSGKGDMATASEEIRFNVVLR